MMEQSRCLELIKEWFTELNRDHFVFRLKPPTIRFGTPHVPSEYGQYENGEMVIRWSLITGDHPHVMAGEAFEEGRWLLVRDILLHLMVHQNLLDIVQYPELNYSGHGPEFRDYCNRIGRSLGLPEVRASKTHVKKRHLVSCSQWPWGVRPIEYYGGAFVPKLAARKSSVDAIVERIDGLNLDQKRELRDFLAGRKLL
jgi:hypothetical protein